MLAVPHGDCSVSEEVKMLRTCQISFSQIRAHHLPKFTSRPVLSETSIKVSKQGFFVCLLSGVFFMAG